MAETKTASAPKAEAKTKQSTAAQPSGSIAGTAPGPRKIETRKVEDLNGIKVIHR